MLRPYFGSVAGILLVIGLAVGAGAQSRGVHDGLLVGGDNVGGPMSWSLYLDPNNVPTSLRTGAGYPTWGSVFGQTLDVDNRTVIVPGILGTASPLTYALIRYDPANQAMVGTIWSGRSSSANFQNWANMTLDSDGDVVTIDNFNRPEVLAKFDRFSRTWKRYPLPPGLSFSGGFSGCEWDAFEGGFHHAASGPPTSQLAKTTWDCRTTRVLANGPANGSVCGGTLVDNGDWISSSATRRYYRIAKGTTVFAAGPPASGIEGFDVTAERHAAPGQGVWLTSSTTRGAYYVNLDTDAVTTVHVGTRSTWPGSGHEITPLGTRDLGTRRTGKATWDLHINPRNGAYPNRMVVTACSLASPKQPGGVKLPDGREIYIGIDDLLAATANGLLPQLLSSNIGSLGPNGRMVAKLNLAPIGAAANGVVLHFCAVVLSGSTVDWVCEPHAFVVEVLP